MKRETQRELGQEVVLIEGGLDNAQMGGKWNSHVMPHHHNGEAAIIVGSQAWWGGVAQGGSDVIGVLAEMTS